MRISQEVGKFLLACGIAAAIILIGTWARGDQNSANVFFENAVGHPLLPDVPGKLGDRDVWCQIDTGSSLTVVDERLQKNLTPTDDTRKVGDSEGKPVALDLFQSPPLTIGFFPVPIKRVGVSDLSQFYLLTGLDHTVILGCDAIGSSVLLCDFDNDRLALRREFQIPDPEEWTTADITFEYSVPFVQQSIAGEDVTFMIATGSTGSIDLTPVHYEALVKSGHIREEEDSSVLSTSGITEVRTGVFTRGTLFGKSLDGVGVATTRLRSKLGMGWLSHFNFAIDFPQSKAHFDQRESFDLRKVAKVLGVMFVYVDEVPIVYVVRPDKPGTSSPAGKAGLEKGDRMVRFDSLEGGEMNLESIYLYLLEHPEGEIPITFLRGQSSEAIRRSLVLGEN